MWIASTSRRLREVIKSTDEKPIRYLFLYVSRMICRVSLMAIEAQAQYNLCIFFG